MLKMLCCAARLLTYLRQVLAWDAGAGLGSMSAKPCLFSVTVDALDVAQPLFMVCKGIAYILAKRHNRVMKTTPMEQGKVVRYRNVVHPCSASSAAFSLVPPAPRGNGPTARRGRRATSENELSG